MRIVEVPEEDLSPSPALSKGAESSTTPRRVVVVDDHALLRAGTRRILDDASGFSVVGEAGDEQTALKVINQHEPDVVLVDIRLSEGNGIDLARQVINERPETTVLILSAYDDENYVRAALAAGVSGYLLKTMPSDELIRSISEACSGTRLPDHASQGQGEKADKPPPGAASLPLTTREREVVRLVARGMSNKAVAHHLGISPRTVEGHVNHIFEKLGTSSRTELVHYSLAESLFARGRSGPPEPLR